MYDEPQHIVLVHGTILLPWLMRDDPVWTGPEHPFRRRLAEAFPDAAIQAFRWRGGNLHSDRLRAARELARTVDGLDGSLLLIGHSHGGNVARMALQLAAPRSGSTRLISLATPFLNIRWHDADLLGRRRSRVSWQAWWSFTWSAALSLLLLTSLVAGLQGIDPLGARMDATAAGAPEVSIWQAAPLTLAVSLATLTLLLALPLAVFFGAVHAIGAALIKRASVEAGDCLDGDWLACVDTRHPQGALQDATAEAVAVENDEAAWSLNLGQAAGSIGAVLGSSADTRRRHGRTRLVLNVLVTAGVLVAALRGGGEGELRFPAVQILAYLEGPIGGLGDELLFAVGAFLLATAALGLIGMCIQIFEYLSAGWDSLVIADRARISVSTPPPGPSTMTLLDVSGARRRRGLRHSGVYEDERAVAAVLAVARGTSRPAAAA